MIPSDTKLRDHGMTLIRQGKYTEAIEHLFLVLEQNPFDRLARCGLGVAKAKVGSLQDGIRDIAQACSQTCRPDCGLRAKCDEECRPARSLLAYNLTVASFKSIKTPPRTLVEQNQYVREQNVLAFLSKVRGEYLARFDDLLGRDPENGFAEKAIVCLTNWKVTWNEGYATRTVPIDFALPSPEQTDNLYHKRLAANQSRKSKLSFWRRLFREEH
jgi:hypothetical protein